MATRKQKHVDRDATHRPSWQGQLVFGLVSFSIEAFNALDRKQSDIHFHQLHTKCHSRIRYQKVCPIHGVVPNDEIVSGYEKTKGKYVEVEKEELKGLRIESDHTLKIDAFVTPEDVDPLYFDGRMFYLAPAAPASQEPYSVVLEAMTHEGRYGLGRLVLSGKEQIALVRPFEKILQMAMLNFHAEIRPTKQIAVGIKKPSALARQVKLAQSLISQWTQDDFDFSTYEDSYRGKVTKLIKAKKQVREAPSPEEEEPAEGMNLMEALKRSVARAPKKTKSSGRVKRRARQRKQVKFLK